jgi:dienelactone hydrolase
MNSVTERQELSSSIRIDVGKSYIEADLILPHDPVGLVVLVHGSRSSRLSPRNRFIASVLRERGLGTLLVDTETPDEAGGRNEAGTIVIDVQGMSDRVLCAADWFHSRFKSLDLSVGFMGAGTGGAAIFFAAASRPDRVRALVARGGRVELASDRLESVKAPTLLLVGARDSVVVDNNWNAIDRIAAREKRLEIIPGARHLFTEPGALAAVAMHSASWFSRYLAPSGIEMVDDTRIWKATAVTGMTS